MTYNAIITPKRRRFDVTMTSSLRHMSDGMLVELVFEERWENTLFGSPSTSHIYLLKGDNRLSINAFAIYVIIVSGKYQNRPPVNTLRPRQSSGHFADDILQHIFIWKCLYFDWDFIKIP